MRSRVLFLSATTVALVTTGTAMADRERQVLPPAVWNWSGGYIGGHGGGGYGRTSFSNPFGPSIYGDVVDVPSFVAGGQIGYNWQNNSWVFGLELDASAAAANGSNTCLAASHWIVSANCNAGPNLFATGTGRIGYAFGALGKTLALSQGGRRLAEQSGRRRQQRGTRGPATGGNPFRLWPSWWRHRARSRASPYACMVGECRVRLSAFRRTECRHRFDGAIISAYDSAGEHN